MLVDDEGDGDAGKTGLPGKLHGGLQLRAPGGAGQDLLREDARHSGPGEGVELWAEGLPGGRGAGVAEADVPDRIAVGACRSRQLVQDDPGLCAAGVGTPSTLASWGTRRKRAVWYWMATLSLLVRHSVTGPHLSPVGKIVRLKP